MCHVDNETLLITFTFHVYDLTFMLGWGGDGHGFTGNKAAKLVTSVRVNISAFVSVQPFDVFGKGTKRFKIFRCDTRR